MWLPEAITYMLSRKDGKDKALSSTSNFSSARLVNFSFKALPESAESIVIQGCIRQVFMQTGDHIHD